MTMATTKPRKAASHAETCKEVATIAYHSENTHALLCAAIAIAERDANKTMTRVLDLALNQIDDLDVALAAFQEEV